MTDWLEDLAHHPAVAIAALILTLAIISAPCGVIAWIVR